MKKSKLLLLGFLLLSFTFSSAQVLQFTPYDELPELNKSYKPTYSDDMPEWGKMLYSYPINFDVIDRAFVKWEAANKDKKTPLMRYYKIWRKAITPYVGADGEIETPDVKLINQNLIRFQTQSLQPRRAPAAANSSNWTFWGPKETYWLNESGSATVPKTAPWQANVYSFDVTDKNPNLLYAGTETGFINKTTDKGKNWELKGTNYPFGGGAGAIAIHPVNLDTVLVGAGTAIHITMDGGETWKRTISSVGGINRMKYDYNNPDKAIACSSNGIYYSNNSGINWYKSVNTDTWDIEYKPGQSDTVYALTKNSANKFIFIQSVNGGKNFSTVTNFPDTLINHSGGLLAVTPHDPDIVLAIVLAKNMNNRPFIYQGTNKQGNWTWIRKFVGSDASFTSNALTSGQGYFDLVLEISPVNKNIVYAGTTTLFKSTNGGASFSAVGGYQGSFGIHPDIQDMKLLANGDTWVATDGGMNLSTNNFTTSAAHFALNKMLVGSDLWGFHQGWNEDIIVGGRYHNGNTSITDFYGEKALRMGGGESPTGWVIQGKSRHVVFDDLGSGWILPKTAEGKPEGRFTFSKHPNMEGYGALRSNVVAHPYYSGQLYVGSENALWVSKDFGSTFDLLYDFGSKVRYFDISTQNPDVIYVDVAGSGFFRSEDGGKTFIKKVSIAGSTGGNLRFVISPYSSDVVYATLTHGVWDETRSEIYKSTNGGQTWEKWSTFGTSILIKTIAIQPTTDGEDLIYAFIDSYGYNSGTVKYRKGNGAWIDFGTDYPNGMRINHALPFFRDSKIRVGGNAGVWESPLAETDFTPVVVPWVEKQAYESPKDTVKFDCHSYLNHKDAVWTWSFSPAPKYVSNIHARNPRVVFKEPGMYSATLSITQNGQTVSKTVTDMVEVRVAPSIDNCDRPGELPKNIMKATVDSYQSGEDGSKAIDGNTSTLWHTPWSGSPGHPHYIQLDLGDNYNISKLIHTPRTDGSNGRIKDYELYISDNVSNWGTYVLKGTFENTSSPTTVEFPVKTGRYVKLVALSEVNDNNWTSIAEIGFIGCRVTTSVNDYFSDATLHAFPIPAINLITVNLPFQNGLNAYSYNVFNTSGQLLKSGNAGENQTSISIDVNSYPSGQYVVILEDKTGIHYRVKFIKR